MMRRIVCVLVMVLAVSCGGPSPEAPAVAQKKEPAPAAKPPDESRRFPSANRTTLEIVDNHLLGKDFFPGGNLAAYERDGKKYQQFLINCESPDQATFLMMDFKSELRAAKFIGHFGGYFGFDGETPILMFPRNNYLAGIAGLPLEDADLVARDFAARLN
jgi:hypothetical protein